MNDFFKAIFIMIMYVFIQSFVLALFVSIIWQIFLAKNFDLYLGYFHWWGIIIIINLLRFDVVEKVNALNELMKTINEENKNENNEIH